ncbi:MAG: DMT family transporter [Prevotellaceae bacterium]|jgi:drug/metabolite transporter (DMT)-like permease|nr:DMT family transporter [Prevotellaceae bacterium]
MPNLKKFIYLFPLVYATIWGMSYIWTNQLLGFGFEVATIVLSRLVISATLLFTFLFITRTFERIKKKDIKWFLMLAFFEPFLYFICETNGLRKTSPTISAVIISTIPLFIPIAAYYFYREKLTVSRFIGTVVSIGGVCLVLFHQGGETILSISGIMFLIAAVFCAVMYNTILKRLSGSHSPVTIVATQNLIGAFYFLPLFLTMEGEGFAHLNIGWAQLQPLLMLSVFASSIAFILSVYTIRTLGMNRACVFSTLVPVMTAVFAFFFGVEDLTLVKLLGIGCVIGGLILTQTTLKKRRCMSTNME